MVMLRPRYPLRARVFPPPAAIDRLDPQSAENGMALSVPSTSIPQHGRAWETLHDQARPVCRFVDRIARARVFCTRLGADFVAEPARGRFHSPGLQVRQRRD